MLFRSPGDARGRCARPDQEEGLTQALSSQVAAPGEHCRTSGGLTLREQPGQVGARQGVPEGALRARSMPVTQLLELALRAVPVLRSRARVVVVDRGHLVADAVPEIGR